MRILRTHTSMKFFLFISIALILTNIPVLGNYLSVVNTLFHESGHALVALAGGDVQQISLFMNTEGVTFTRHTSWFGGFFTGIAGYVFSSFMAFLSFWLIGKKQYKLLIAILLGFILMNLVFWVRNFYGVFWLVSFGAAFLLMLYKGKPKLVQNVLLAIASLLLVDSISSAFDILLLSFLTPETAGDAANLANATVFVPAQVWGIFFFLQALWFSVMGLKRGLFKLD